ncbi:MAG: malonic semialdehyde reductase [Parvularculales bacterium]
MTSADNKQEELEEIRKAAQDDIRALREEITELDQSSVDLIITRARSHNAWKDTPVTDAQIQRMYDIVKMGSTSMNSCPARFIFVRSKEGKDRLAKSVKPTNLPKLMGAPLTVIVAYDTEFWKELPKLFPHEDRRPMFEGNKEFSLDTAYRNSTLQGAYLMIAARAIGLDVGAMSGFSNEVVDQEFFAGTTFKSNFLCNIGTADETGVFQRLPRFDFDEACSFA